MKKQEDIKMVFRKRILLSVLPVWILLVGVLAVSAQASTPINVGENKTGELTQTAPSASFSLTIAAPQVVQIQVFEITQGLAPAFRVVDSSGTPIQSAVNPTIDFNNPSGGTYDVWVGSPAANTSISGTLYITGASDSHP